MTRVVLMHGKDTDPTKKWYPWFMEQLREKNIEVAAPVLPKPTDPVLDEWIAELKKVSPDENTILVGHSRGGVAILRWMEMLPENARVKKVILVAANWGGASDRRKDETNYGFYTDDGYDFNAIKSHCDVFVVLHSKDDPWVPFSQGEKNAKGLGAKFLIFDDKKHFGKGVDEVPELLEEVFE